MMFGLVVLGSNRATRALLTLSSSAWLSVVPRKFTPAVVPAFPPSFQYRESVTAVSSENTVPTNVRPIPFE